MEARGRVVLVTGASSGIGRETARLFAGRGDVVVGTARRQERLRTLAEECRALGARDAGWLAGDLGEPAFAEGLVGQVVARHGRLDVLVHNAGMPKRQAVFALSCADAERVMEVNFLSCVRTTLAAIPVMLRQGGGCIVNVSSFTAKVVPPRESLYAASKWALAGFSEGLWSDLAASNIHVALVTPGPIDTEIWDHGPASAYRGRRHPPRLVAEAILEAVERRRHEVSVPRRSPPLLLARLLRLVAPSLLRAGMRRMDPVELPPIVPDPVDAVPILDALTRLYRRRGHEIVTGIPPRFSNLAISEFTFVVSDDSTSLNAVGISPVEIYFLEHLFHAYRPRSILVVGNGFGWSSFALSLLNPETEVVVIEAGMDDVTARWIERTNAIAREEGMRVRVVKGVSPGDVASVVASSFSGPIDFVFIDGEHTNQQVQLDFEALRPHTHERSVFLFHDVLFWNLVEGLNRIVAQSGLDAHLLWRTSTGMVLLCRDALHLELVELLKSFELGPKTAALLQALRQQQAEAAARPEGG